MNHVFKEEPVPFVFLDKDNKFQIGEEALEILSHVKGNIGVVAIAGLYRTGKSFVLNRLLRRQQGFEIGSTSNSCTKGIYIWGHPITVRNENNIEVNVIVMDTEGIGSLDKDQTYDAKIFSLAVLISSYFIYNSVGVIDDSALEKISFVAQLTQHIRKHSESQGCENQNAKELAPYFPSLLWLLRDFAVKLVDENNNAITSSQYLEQALTRPSQDKKKNEVRQVITNAFQTRDCVTLVRPVFEEEDLQNLDKIPYDNLRDKFRSEAESLTKKVFDRVKPKYVFGQPIDGEAYITLVKSYVEAMNNGTVPTIHSAWDMISDRENKKVVDAAFDALLRYFEENVCPRFPLDLVELEKQKALALDICSEIIGLGAVGKIKQEYLDELNKRIANEFTIFQMRNCEASSDIAYIYLFDQLDKTHSFGNLRFVDVVKQESEWETICFESNNSNWRMFGQHLGFTRRRLDDVERRCKENPTKQLLIHWQSTTPATMKNFITAMVKANNGSVLNELKKLFPQHSAEIENIRLQVQPCQQNPSSNMCVDEKQNDNAMLQMIRHQQLLLEKAFQRQPNYPQRITYPRHFTAYEPRFPLRKTHNAPKRPKSAAKSKRQPEKSNYASKALKTTRTTSPKRYWNKCKPWDQAERYLRQFDYF